MSEQGMVANKGRDALAEVKKILNDAKKGHDTDRAKAGQLLDAIAAGTVQVSGTF